MSNYNTDDFQYSLDISEPASDGYHTYRTIAVRDNVTNDIVEKIDVYFIAGSDDNTFFDNFEDVMNGFNYKVHLIDGSYYADYTGV